ncbi:MAG: DNA-binding transcriptional regulator [Verrucomicrobiota bacterium]
MMEVSRKTLEHWNPDGIITNVHLAHRGGVKDLSGVPVVGVGSFSHEQEAALDLPLVTSNHAAIGKMAARHFIGKGFKSFAFCGGTARTSWCEQRRVGFQQELEDNHFDLSVYEPDFGSKVIMPEAIASLAKWLKGLPKPAGVFAFFDGWARWILEACLLADLKVPQEVAVLGVDNDRWLCELSQPRLSSVDPNIATAGFMAAKILDGMLKGEKAPDLTTIDPVGVEERDSTDFMAFEESEVVFAVRYIREHSCDPISPSDVLAVTGMSNSTAHRKFMKELGHSIHAEIQRVQLERVKELLTTTNLSVTEVGEQAGFDNVRYFTKVFRDAFGCTPKHYRKTQGTAGV